MFLHVLFVNLLILSILLRLALVDDVVFSARFEFRCVNLKVNSVSGSVLEVVLWRFLATERFG